MPSVLQDSEREPTSLCEQARSVQSKLQADFGSRQSPSLPVQSQKCRIDQQSICNPRLCAHQRPIAISTASCTHNSWTSERVSDDFAQRLRSTLSLSLLNNHHPHPSPSSPHLTSYSSSHIISLASPTPPPIPRHVAPDTLIPDPSSLRVQPS